MKVKNLLFQPISLHLAIDGEGLHLNAREVREVLADRVSVEIRTAAERGMVSLIQATNTVPVADDGRAIADVVPIDAQTATQKKGNRR